MSDKIYRYFVENTFDVKAKSIDEANIIFTRISYNLPNKASLSKSKLEACIAITEDVKVITLDLDYTGLIKYYRMILSAAIQPTGLISIYDSLHFEFTQNPKKFSEAVVYLIQAGYLKYV